MSLISDFRDKYEPFDLSFERKKLLVKEVNKYLKRFRIVLSRKDDEDGDYELCYDDFIYTEHHSKYNKEADYEVFLMVIGLIDIQKIKNS